MLMIYLLIIFLQNKNKKKIKKTENKLQINIVQTNMK